MSKRQDRSDMRLLPTDIVEAILPNEVWVSTVGFEGYFVSNQGRVCSVDRIVNGKICRGVLLRPHTTKDGHVHVLLGRGNHAQVHTLVLTAFVGQRPIGMEGLHWDDKPDNNALANLRWGTRTDNLNDAVRNGKKPTGERVSNSKLNDDAVRFIRSNTHLNGNQLSIKFSVSPAAIKQVRDGVTWKNVA